MDYQKYLSKCSKDRKAPIIRALFPYMGAPDMISLGAGQPNPGTFPYESVSVTLKTGETIKLSADLFQRSLSYDLTSGLPQLNEWLRKLQIREHSPSRDFDLSIGSGSQDLLTKALEMCIDPGTPLLVEDPTYTGALSFLGTLDCELVPVKTDGFGILPESLETLLADWPNTNPTGNKDAPRPLVIYTVPSGGNPTGASPPLERKKKVYEICSKYDILIIEDDPYYFLQFGQRIPSYFSMDVDGRVLRLDSMSKVLSSGMRIGWVSGPKELIERINLHTMTTNLQPSGITQLMAYDLLAFWGIDGFLTHVDGVAKFYREKRDSFVECLDRHLTGIAEWTVPDAGMFVWIKLLGGIEDSFDLILQKAIKKNVLAVPGISFMPDGKKTPYLRLSYSCVSYEQMDEGLRRLAAAIREEIAEINAH